MSNEFNLKNNSNIANIPLKKGGDVFFKWLSFLQPLHGLTYKEMQVMAAFLKKRFELSDSVKDDAMIDTILKSPETRKEIRDSLLMNVSQFNVILSSLRKNKAIIGNSINKRFVPNMEQGTKEVRLVIRLMIEEWPEK